MGAPFKRAGSGTVAVKLASLPAGRYAIDYTDRTHLDEKTWIQLAELDIERGSAPPSEPDQPVEPFFTVLPNIQLPTVPGFKADKLRPQLRVILDQLALALARVGLLRPDVDSATLHEVWGLTQEKAVVLIPDTNVLNNGTLHWLLRSLTNVNVWLVPVAVSVAQIQQRDGMLRSHDRHRDPQKPEGAGRVLRTRSMINPPLSLLERYRSVYQVLEVDPQLLRYVRPSGGGTVDPESTDVIEDRLLVEAIHTAIGSMRSATKKRVVTSDVMLARILHAEAIDYLFLPSPRLTGGEALACVRFEPIANEFQGATLTDLLWDMAHSFSRVRLRDSTGTTLVELSTYWEGKNAREWINEQLQVVYGPAHPAVPTSSDTRPKASRTPAAKQSQRSFVVVEVSFKQVTEATKRLMEGMRLKESSLTRRLGQSFKLLEIAGLARRRDSFWEASPKFIEFKTAWEARDLDRMSTLLEPYQAYAVLLKQLRASRRIPVAFSATESLALWGDPAPGPYAYQSILRYPVYLGQAWTDGGFVVGGTTRPDHGSIEAAFSRVFTTVQRDQIAQLANLLPALCREVNSSPWFVVNSIEEIVARGGLQQFSFDPSLGGRRGDAKDQVVARFGTETPFTAVPTDRIYVGSRPVYAVIRRV
jgi:hypothetical protein